jgi:uncharacterized protein (TIGR01777 family)
MSIVVSGASGLIGSALTDALREAGHGVTRLVRSSVAAGKEGLGWDPSSGPRDPQRLEGIEAVVHLAGAGIASGRWSAARKELIRASRVEGTRTLATALASLRHPPRTLLCASAVGFYGDRGAEVLGEESLPGTGFLASVCRAWEEAATPASAAGIRVVHMRFGVVLSREGGALRRMLVPFRLGLGGPLGNGAQYMSWIALDDAVAAILRLLGRAEVRGAVNLVAPHPVTNLEFTRALGRVLSRPTLFAVPAVAARLAFGEMADEMLLASTRAMPMRLEASGYTFRYPDIDAALGAVLGPRPH